MPLRLKIKKELTARSDRVKSVDIFPNENPWVLAALYSGNVFIWDYSTNTMIKSFETGTNPVRCAKFIVRKQWIVAATDDMKMRVFNYNTMDKVKEWDAHTDYIRYIEIHPNRPYILSSSDDMSIKLWDWDKDFDCVQVFEGHSHYVMMVRINPRDTNVFASASLDKSIKVWGLTAGTAHFSLDGAGSHEKGVNCVDYYPGGDKPYLLSGSDDRTVKIWDYQTKACLQTLEGHAHNVSAVCFHPRLPIILSASEDGTVRLWHSTTYRPETTLNYGLERAWCIAVAKDSNKIAVGYDEGTIVLKLGNEKPVASLDTNSAKLVWAQGHDVQTTSLKGLSKETELVDGERVTLATRDLGACEVYPQQLQHNCNGSFIVICGDGEYIIYTSQALRNKSFGSALDFVWSANGSGDYAIRESISRVRTFKNFKDHKQITLPIASADGLFGGNLIAVKGPECVVFFDWDEGQFIRRIDVVPIAIYWSEAGDSVVIACSDCFYILRYDQQVVANALAAGNINPEEGVDGSFELVATINERVFTGQWVGECFLYTNGNRRLNYTVGGETMTLCHLNAPMYLLGFVPKEDRVFLIDKSYNVSSYKLLLSVLSYQTAVVRKDFDTANDLLRLIPPSEYSAVARFLESQGFKEEALAVTDDLDHKFELAVDLKKMEIAHNVLVESDRQAAASGIDVEDSSEVQGRWRRLGDLALLNGELKLAEACARRSNDLSGLLLLYTSVGNKPGVMEVALKAKEQGRNNVAFLAYFLTGYVEEAVELLVECNRIPEAAFMARTYLPSQVSRILDMWKADLKPINAKAAEALADPEKYPNLFPDFEWAVKVEKMFLQARTNFVPAQMYPTAKGDLDLNLIEFLKAQATNGQMEAMQKQISEMNLTTPPAAPAPITTASKSESADNRIDDHEVEVEVEPEPEPEPSPTAKSPVATSPLKSNSNEEVLAAKSASPVAASPPRSAAPAPTPATVKAAPTEKEEEEDRDLDDILEEEDRLLNQNSSPTKSPVPAKEAEKPAVVPAKAEEEEEDDDELDLDDLDDNNNNDVLEKDEEGFDSNEDW